MYAYFDGENWIEGLSGKDIKRLALEGIIQKGTTIRFPDGKEAFASKINGLEFAVLPNLTPSTPQVAFPQVSTNATSTPQPTVIYVNTPLPPQSQAIPALASFFWPGLGQLIQGRAFAWLFWVVLWIVSLCLCLILIGYITTPLVYIGSILDAAWYKPKPGIKYTVSRFLKFIALVVGIICLTVIATVTWAIMAT